MHEPTYRAALGSAWKLVLRHKLLWAFGLLSLMLGQFGWSGFLGQLAFFPQDSVPFTTLLVSMPWWQFFVHGNAVWSVWLLVILLPVVLLVVLMAIAAEGALVAAATSWYKGHRFVDLESAWHRGTKHFWRLLGVHMVKKVILLALLLLINALIQLLLPAHGIWSAVGTVVLVTLGIFVALGVAVTAIYAKGYVVEEEDDLRTAVERGWKLFHEHLLVSFEVSLIFLALEVVLTGVIALSAVWFLAPFVALSVLGGLTGMVGLISAGFIISSLLFIIIAAMVGGFLNAFTVSTWMYLYMKMHHEGVGSRIFHWFKRIF